MNTSLCQYYQNSQYGGGGGGVIYFVYIYMYMCCVYINVSEGFIQLTHVTIALDKYR